VYICTYRRITIHKTPYNDLTEYGDNRTDEFKVDTLLTKVSGDSSLSSACTFIRNDSRDFTAAIQYLSNEVQARNRVVNTNNTRSISAVSPRKNGQRNRNSNGGIGQTASQGKQNTGDRYSKEGHIFLNDGIYSNHIWWNVLSEEERKYCESLRQRRRNRNKNAQSRNERHVSNVETRNQDNSEEHAKPARMLVTECRGDDTQGND